MTTPEGNQQHTDHNNARLVYEYTARLLDQRQEGIDRVERQMTTLLGFSGIFLVLATNLPGEDKAFFLKVGACLMLVVAVVLCGWGLVPRAEGNVVAPEELLETHWFYEPDYLCRLFIARQWVEAKRELEELYSKKVRILSSAYISLLLFTLVCITDIIYFS